ncbi:unnamed protein product [Cladocopium goreaui]|uniref:Leucine-rich repeat-containing protein LOC400891-like n=1 Tax=Cladocopium goreaui TaxID=2562237 RepID=A0A9P1GE37_9DINO|nr:unnamed protein product [Cladocopium goreaui]
MSKALALHSQEPWKPGVTLRSNSDSTHVAEAFSRLIWACLKLGKIKGGKLRLTDLTERLLTERSMVNGCVGVDRVVTLCFSYRKSHWSVGQVLRAALVLEAQDGRLAVESLAMSPWPISELLGRAQMNHQGRGARAVTGTCACDMSFWSPVEARAVAETQRVLEEINQLTSEDVDQISEVALSATLCDSITWDSRLLTATTLLKEMVKDPQIQQEEADR